MGRELCFTIPGNFDFSCFSSCCRSRFRHRFLSTFGPLFPSFLESKAEENPVFSTSVFLRSLDIVFYDFRNKMEPKRLPKREWRQLRFAAKMDTFPQGVLCRSLGSFWFPFPSTFVAFGTLSPPFRSFRAPFSLHFGLVGLLSAVKKKSLRHPTPRSTSRQSQAPPHEGTPPCPPGSILAPLLSANLSFRTLPAKHLQTKKHLRRKANYGTHPDPEVPQLVLQPYVQSDSKSVLWVCVRLRC